MINLDLMGSNETLKPPWALIGILTRSSTIDS